jgi:restriction system protein
VAYDESLIGQKFGHLTAVKKLGRYFRFSCDCGFEKTLRPTDVCRGAIISCGRSECKHHIERGINTEALKAREEGLAFEQHLADVFEKAGYVVTRTPDSGDFGVDVIVEIKGEKWAFQCKKLKVPAGVRGVAEVYAGGRYYDCTRFCVASPSGFTRQAKAMAAKLGVQLETNVFHFNVSAEQNAAELLQTHISKYEYTKKVIWEIDGIPKPAEQWCKEYGISKKTVESRIRGGMDLKTALTKPLYGGRVMIEINGVVKSKLEWCKEYGVSTQLYDYRTKQAGLSPFEALTKEVSCRA